MKPKKQPTSKGPEQHTPFYQQVKTMIRQRIERGEWLPGMKILSESELVAETGFSRMTVNRALRELSNEGCLERRQGQGSFVTEFKAKAPLLEIRSIADEIRSRGGIYSCDVHLLQEEKARPDVARRMGLQPYESIYHSVIVHKNRAVPIQLSSRYINPAIAPNYLKQDFTSQTPSEYLLSLAPVSAVEHVIEALIPETWIGDLLKINNAEPCLALHRKTWVAETIATSSIFYYPGSRYTLGSKFIPTASGSVQIC